MRRRSRFGQKRRAEDATPEEQVLHTKKGRRMLEDLSPLGALLIEKWSWGILAAATVQELAHAAVLSGCDKEDVKEHAALGASGHCSGNMNRDLRARFVREGIAPTAFVLDVPMKFRVRSEMVVRPVTTQLLLPHDWFASLDTHDLVPSALGTSTLEQFLEQPCDTSC